jgi:hypothetical protein
MLIPQFYSNTFLLVRTIVAPLKRFIIAIHGEALNGEVIRFNLSIFQALLAEDPTALIHIAHNKVIHATVSSTGAHSIDMSSLTVVIFIYDAGTLYLKGTLRNWSEDLDFDDRSVRGNRKRKMMCPAASDGELAAEDNSDEETNDMIIEGAPEKAKLTPNEDRRSHCRSGLCLDAKHKKKTQSKRQRMMELSRK